MAHRTNVIQVMERFRSLGPEETVEDPVCHKKLNRRESRHVLFRGEDTYYFCSRECESQFITRGKRKVAA